MLEITATAVTKTTALPALGLPDHERANLEAIMVTEARVSNPVKPERIEGRDKLLLRFIETAEWSPLEMAHVTLRVDNAPLDTIAQLLRHGSFKFQQHSGRYAPMRQMFNRFLRLQDTTNRQNSLFIDVADPQQRAYLMEYAEASNKLAKVAQAFYEHWLSRGAAREVARSVLPQGAPTTIYVCGNVRSWFHYCGLRRKERGAQFEHVYMAEVCNNALVEHLPKLFQTRTEMAEQYKGFLDDLRKHRATASLLRSD